MAGAAAPKGKVVAPTAGAEVPKKGVRIPPAPKSNPWNKAGEKAAEGGADPALADADEYPSLADAKKKKGKRPEQQAAGEKQQQREVAPPNEKGKEEAAN